MHPNLESGLQGTSSGISGIFLQAGYENRGFIVCTEVDPFTRAVSNFFHVYGGVSTGGLHVSWACAVFAAAPFLLCVGDTDIGTIRKALRCDIAWEILQLKC
jgi:hypothetical protein